MLEAKPIADLELLEQRLSAFEERMTELARSRLTLDEIMHIKGEIEPILASFRTKMTATQIKTLEHLEYSRILFKRAGLPRLSLVYMSDNPSLAA
jgi:hypothetical protein